MQNRTSLQTISGILCVLFLLISCKDNTSSAPDDPPQLPPARSMEMDFSTFQNQQNSGSKVQTADNFSRAVVTAVIMKAAVDINLAIPKALLRAASNAEAELNADEEWEWSYSKTEGENMYAVRLVAAREGDDTVNWEFYVTNSELALDNVLFFSGTTNSDGTEGTWIYYNLQGSELQQEVSRVDWIVNGKDDVQLRLEITSDRNNHLGDYIDYTFDGTYKTAVYYDASDEATTEIQLTVDTNVGYIVTPNYNGGQQSCWDSDFQDVACEDL